MSARQFRLIISAPLAAGALALAASSLAAQGGGGAEPVDSSVEGVALSRNTPRSRRRPFARSSPPTMRTSPTERPKTTF